MSCESLEGRIDHVAVNLGHFIIVFGGTMEDDTPLSLREIWMYNCYTEQGMKYVVPLSKQAPPATWRACAVTINSHIYMFGGRAQTSENWEYTNALWKLSRMQSGKFEWKQIKYQSKNQSPSPRSEPAGWNYEENLWIFGGEGPTPDGYLYDKGYFDDRGENDQLLRFDISCKKWTSPECFGNTPFPRARPATTIIEERVWLIGGYSCSVVDPFDVLYELDMHSLVWTEITTGHPHPAEHKDCTLTAITNHQLVFHGCFTNYSECAVFTFSWILDLQSMTWTKHPHKITDREECCRSSYTCTLAFSGKVMVVGGMHYDDANDFPDCPPHTHQNIHMMLEPKTLKQLAVKTIYNNRDTCPLDNLPRKLTSLLEFL